MGVVFDSEMIRIVVDDVSDGNGTEFRATLFDDCGNVDSEAWAATPSESVRNLFVWDEEVA